MNTLEKKIKAIYFTDPIFPPPPLLPFSIWIKTAREEGKELNTGIISLAAEAHKKSQTSKCVKWTEMNVLMIQQQLPPTCVG